MIQRIQTLYLIMTIILSLLFLAGNIFTFADDTGALHIASVKGITDATGGKIHGMIPVTVIVLLTILISGIAIFSFRNRKIQSRLALSAIILSGMLILTSAYCIWAVMTEFQIRFIAGYKIFLPLLMLLFAILAYRGIKKDDNLVKSYDRLR